MKDIPVRCTCRAAPILGIVRPTTNGRVVLHIRVHRGGKVDAEIVVEDGLVRISCRACSRWYAVHIRRERFLSSPEELPDTIQVPSLN